MALFLDMNLWLKGGPIINCENIPEEGDNKTSEVLLYDPFISRKVEDEDQDDIFYELLANNAELTIDDNMSNDNIDAEPSYLGASVTIGAFMLLKAIISTKFNLIGDGVVQLLKIIALALSNGHQLCTSLHSFKTYFRNLRNPLIKHYY